MRYSTVPAINLEQHVARNRELITAQRTETVSDLVWNPATLDWIMSTYEVTATQQR